MTFFLVYGFLNCIIIELMGPSKDSEENNVKIMGNILLKLLIKTNISFMAKQSDY